MAKSVSVDQAMKQAKTLASQGRIGEARAVYQQVLAKFPANKRAAQALKALASDPRQSPQMQVQAALNGLIQLFNQGKFDEVIARAEEMAKTLPKLPILPNMIGAALSAKREYEAAAAQYEKALELDPNLIPAHSNLGAAKAELSLFDEAIGHYEEALRLDPTYAQAHNNMANALRQLGQIEDAVDRYRQAISFNDKLADAHGNLGSCLAALGQLDEALISLDHAAALDPTKAENEAQRGGVLQRLNRLPEALAAYDTAIERNREPDYLNSRGNVLASLDRHEEAIASFREVLSINDESTEAWTNLCSVYETTNQITELAQTVAEAGDAIGAWDPQNRLWAGVLAARQGDDAQACEFLEGILPDELPETLQARQSDFLGRAQDRLGRSAEAFENFQRMNALASHLQAGRDVDPLRFVDDVAAVKVSLDEANEVDWSNGDDGSDLIFMVGMPRSGTTLLDTILRGHPTIEGVEEGPMVEAAQRSLGGPATIDALTALSDGDLEAMRQAYRTALDERLCEVPPGTRVVDKLPLNIVNIPLIHRLFPGAHILLVLRHPCDAVLSCYMQNFRLDDAKANFLDLEDTAALYNLAMEVWSASVEKLPIKTSQLRYEDLVEDLEGTVRPLLSDLGLEWADEMADFQETARARGLSYAQVSQGLDKTAKGRWEWYRLQMDPVLDTLQPWVAHWGYDL